MKKYVKFASKKMIEKLEEISVDHFSFDYFKRNDNKKCIEISTANRIEAVDRFYLYIDHTDCSSMCFVVCFSVVFVRLFSLNVAKCFAE